MKPLARLLLAGALSCAAAGALGAAEEPAWLPNPTAGVVRRTLPNGLRVLVRPRRTAPVVTTMMWYRVGSRDEVAGATGLAHFLEHLMFKGTRTLKKGEVDRLTYLNGGSNNAFTFNDYTAYFFNFPRRNWKTALRIEADRMRNCAFDAKEFDAERQVVMEERRASEDDPAQQLSEQVNAMAFLAHPYRNPVIGWMSDLKRVSRDEVYAFYQKYYVPANATLVITGDVSAEEALASAAAAFARVPRLPAPRRPVVSEPEQAAARRLRLELPTGVARLELTFPVPNRSSADVYALHLLEYALGEGKLSRLHRRLVEGDRTAASVSAGLGIYRDLGSITFSAAIKDGVDPQRLEAALWEELERAAREPLSPQELERARNQFAADWVQGLETAEELATVIGEADSLGGHQYLETLVPRVLAATAADVQRAAARFLRRERSTVGHLLPRAETPSTGGQRGVGPGRGIGNPSLNGSVLADAGRTANGTPSGGRPRQRGVSNPSRTHAFGRKERRAPPRTAGTQATFAPLRPVERTLPNGMKLVLLESHELPAVTLSARVRAGSLYDSAERSGLASFTARMLEEGTASRDHAAISAALEQVGASFSATATREATTAELTALSRHAGNLLPLFVELLRAPAFPEERLVAERARVLVELKEEADESALVARKAFFALVFGEHPAARPVGGTEAGMRALTRADLAAFHARHFRPEKTTLVAVGDFRAPELLERLTAAFGDWSRGSAGADSPLHPITRQTESREQRLRMEKAQTQVVLGHLGVPRTSPDFVALKVMDTILGEGVGGGFTARIPYQLRDVQGLAYSVGSSITSSAGAQPGVFAAMLGTEPGKADAAIAALRREIARIRREPVTAAERREAQNYLADSYVFDFQTHAQLARYLHTVLAYDLGYDYRQRFPALVRRVTRADVQRVAGKYLDPEHMTLVVVGPREPASQAPRR